MESRRILVPIDGSALSLQAVEAAAGMAQRSGASLTLLTAIEPPEAARALVSEASLQEVRRRLSLAAANVLDQAASRVTPQQLRMEKRVVQGGCQVGQDRLDRCPTTRSGTVTEYSLAARLKLSCPWERRCATALIAVGWNLAGDGPCLRAGPSSWPSAPSRSWSSPPAA
jgi:Universal stress protein family